MKLSRDAWLAMGLFTVLAILTAFAAARQTEEEKLPPLSSRSTAPDGAQALRLWLEALNYPLDNTVPDIFDISNQTSLILILEPTELIAPAEWKVIDEWVEAGGSLLLVGDDIVAGVAARHYDFTLTPLAAAADALTAQTPLFTSPPLTTEAQAQARAYFQTNRADYVALLAVAEGPVIVSFAAGQGRVVLSAVPYPFSNAGLKEAGNGALALNVISAISDRRPIWFDEWHHGVRSVKSQLAGPTDWLLAAPAGRALLLVAVVIFLALLFRGRRFGRPVPLAKDIVRRAPLEYITALANLNRRAGHRAAVLRQYHHSLKRALGQRYRLSPQLPDAQYARQLAAYNPAIDEKALLDLLAGLSRRNVSESEMIQLAARAAEALVSNG